MRVEIVQLSLLARHAAVRLANALGEAVEQRGIATLAVSGGSTPAEMFDELTQLRVPWEHVHLFQVDERVAPDGHEDRNLVQLRAHLVDRVAGPLGGVHPMPVSDVHDDAGAARAAGRYAGWLREVAGDPPVLDVVHLGLGADGHTASLVPDDPVLDVRDRSVAVSRTYQGRQRLTLTFPVLERAREVVFLAAGADKAKAVAQLVDGDPTIPAGRLQRNDAVLLLDPEAASSLR